MHKAIVATVGLLLLSVAALAGPAGGAATSEADETAGSQRPVATGSTAVVAAAGATTPSASRARPLALPGLDSIGPPLLLAVGGLLGLLLGVGALLFGRGRSPAVDGSSADATAERGDGNGIPTTPQVGDQHSEGSPQAVRTDEEYVVQLLIANHGRMRQAQIVEETDWSKAKVSRLLSRMEEREQVVRERAGREKIVQLADANTSVPV